MPGGARASARLGVHPRPEVCEPLLGEFLVGSREYSSVLLEGVEEDKEVARALVQDAVSRVRESDPWLA